MRKLSKNVLAGALVSAVTGAAIVASAGIANAKPIEPNCQWDKYNWPQYKLAYPQGCTLKEYDSKEPATKHGPYTS